MAICLFSNMNMVHFYLFFYVEIYTIIMVFTILTQLHQTEHIQSIYLLLKTTLKEDLNLNDGHMQRVKHSQMRRWRERVREWDEEMVN